MKIKTITCHDVYNVGASLQAYALSEFLRQQGHDVEIIDYKPDYLSKHYNFKAVDNPRYENPFFLRWIYLILKFPKRLMKYPGKQNFDKFRDKYLRLTKRYNSLEELKQNPPEADLYIAGSDQIWNTLFKNGRDGAFYLEFAPKGVSKASYAASFSTDKIANGWEERVKSWLSDFDHISVREKSSLRLLDEMAFEGCSALDPVFLLNKEQWKSLIRKNETSNDVFIYDFDGNSLMERISDLFKEKFGYKTTSFFPVNYSDVNLRYPGPLEFLETIYQSKVVVSNSFHATVLSLIFHKDFYVIKRNEDINVRMVDLLKLFELEDRILANENELIHVKPIDWNRVDLILNREREKSTSYLMELTKENEDS